MADVLTWEYREKLIDRYEANLDSVKRGIKTWIVLSVISNVLQYIMPIVSAAFSAAVAKDTTVPVNVFAWVSFSLTLVSPILKAFTQVLDPNRIKEHLARLENEYGEMESHLLSHGMVGLAGADANRFKGWFYKWDKYVASKKLAAVVGINGPDPPPRECPVEAARI